MKTIRNLFRVLCFLLAAATSSLHGADDRPNIVIIMADDLGYSDIGCYGGEIHTPTLDKLAENGVRFTNFYNTSRCCPTRASLLTGLYPHQAGMGRMTAGAGGSDESLPGYQGRLRENAVTIAEVLKGAGYQTAMVGKWHLSHTPNHGGEKQLDWLDHQIDLGDFSDRDTYPVARGFERYYGNIWGVVNFFDPFSLVEGAEPVKEVPDDYYITDALNDKTVEYLDEMAQGDQPFFLYLAHCAPHWPLHALPEDIEKYEGTYTVGWQPIREARYERMVKMGLIDPDTAPLSERIDPDQKWEDEENQDWEAAAMAAHAAMVDRMDQGLARVIAKLESLGKMENTLILFLSDNGASAAMSYRPGFDRSSRTREGEKILYTDEMLEKNIKAGPETTYTGIRRHWANVANTPFRYWKQEEYQGGVATPLIAHWPRGIELKPGAISGEPGHVIDLMATCLDVAGAEYPKERKGQAVTPLEGKSLLPVFKTGSRDGHEAIYFEHFGARAVRQGDWKLVALAGKPWELYDLAHDFTETRNLASEHPDKVTKLAALWEAWAHRVQVYPAPGQKKTPEPPKNPAPAQGGTDGEVTLNLKKGDVREGAEAPDLTNRSVTVKATVADAPANGVIVSQGGFLTGYALSLKDGRPVFAVRRSKDDIVELAGPDKLPGGKVSLEARLDADGKMELQVNGKSVAKGKAAGLLERQPGDGLAVGDDPLSNVGTYGDEANFTGKIPAVSIVFGAPIAGAAGPAGSASAAAGGATTKQEPEGTMKTRWAAQVDQSQPHPEYPRPQLVRDEWTNLNGQWEYAIASKDADAPKEWAGKILVPFAIESQLSGVQKAVGADERLWYRRSFETPATASGRRVLLHFGAVDWHATVYVNGKEVGQHKGGYDPFSFDITEALNEGGKQELVVSVWDPTDTEAQARGKQVNEPGGIWYTAVTGIWQTVWLEAVPDASIRRLQPEANIEKGELKITAYGRRTQPEDRINVRVRDGDTEVASGSARVGEPAALKIDDHKTWSPDAPHLYDVEVDLVRDGTVVDTVRSYAAMREIARRKDEHGAERFYLNGEPLFHYGPLDQGWWPDGLYTAPTEEAMVYDIEMTKKMGFNMIRKHVKVEPARWYYHCDLLGMLVWQDMPSGYQRAERETQHVDSLAPMDWERPEESAQQFELELAEMIQDFGFFPCIVMWVPLNEGWGQYDTERLAKWVAETDPTRLVNAVSGWTDRGVGDMIDLHQYPGPGMEPIELNPGRAVVLGEFGGLGWPVADHLWWDKRNWGYRTYSTQEELQSEYRKLMVNLYPMIDRGLAAAVYTQTTDVEGEVNGLMTYDREVIKIAPEDLQRLHAPLYRPAGDVVWHAEDSEVRPQAWRYTFEKPAAGWDSSDFDDQPWDEGKAPFKSGRPDHFDRQTPWEKPEIWMRRSFEVAEPTKGLSLKVYCEAQAEIYVNGTLVQKIEDPRVRRHYDDLNISEHAGVLKKGKNVIAIHAVKPKGKRGIDIGLYGYDAVKVPSSKSP